MAEPVFEAIYLQIISMPSSLPSEALKAFHGTPWTILAAGPHLEHFMPLCKLEVAHSWQVNLKKTSSLQMNAVASCTNGLAGKMYTGLHNLFHWISQVPLCRVLPKQLMPCYGLETQKTYFLKVQNLIICSASSQC